MEAGLPIFKDRTRKPISYLKYLGTTKSAAIRRMPDRYSQVLNMATFTKPSCCSDCSKQFVCRCLRVTEEQILTALTTYRPRTIKELRALTGAGDGCTCCHRLLQHYIDQYQLCATIPMFESPNVPTTEMPSRTNLPLTGTDG